MVGSIYYLHYPGYLFADGIADIYVVWVVQLAFVEGDVSGSENSFEARDPYSVDIRRIVADEVAQMSTWLEFLLTRDVFDMRV
jgi:hypothetical protein